MSCSLFPVCSTTALPEGELAMPYILDRTHHRTHQLGSRLIVRLTIGVKSGLWASRFYNCSLLLLQARGWLSLHYSALLCVCGRPEFHICVVKW